MTLYEFMLCSFQNFHSQRGIKNHKFERKRSAPAFARAKRRRPRIQGLGMRCRSERSEHPAAQYPTITTPMRTGTRRQKTARLSARPMLGDDAKTPALCSL